MGTDAGYAYSFQRAELTLDRAIFTGISNVSIDQPTTEGAVPGTRPGPIKRTQGSMELGEGTITFSDEEERVRFLKKLGNAYREKIWELTWTLTAPLKPAIKVKCESCRVLSNAISHESGTDALGGDITFSFLNHSINGNYPHSRS